MLTFTAKRYIDLGEHASVVPIRGISLDLRGAKEISRVYKYARRAFQLAYAIRMDQESNESDARPIRGVIDMPDRPKALCSLYFCFIDLVSVVC